ncbi:hypothetical protein BH10PSE2_BH10PSE2_20040 [soil metagenome]
MLLAFGLVSAVLSARETGRGQVVDCVMTEGSSLLMSMVWGLRNAGLWSDRRGTNLLDTGAHFYDTYETLDARFIAVGAIEPQFYEVLRDRLGLSDDPAFDAQMDASTWPALKARMAEIFKTRTRDAWCEAMAGLDACFAPVLDMSEVAAYPHNVARGAFVDVAGQVQPAPAPRYSLTRCDPPRPAPTRPTLI